MPIDLDKIKKLDPAKIRGSDESAGVDWDSLFEALVELGFGQDSQGFSVSDIHLLTRKFANGSFDPEGYPISKQRVYKWTVDKWENGWAIRFKHPTARHIRYVFFEEKVAKDDPELGRFVYQE